jgi:phage-related protein (TIGR01555 family)
MTFFEWVRSKWNPEPKEAEEVERERPSQFSTDIPIQPVDRDALFDDLIKQPVFKGLDKNNQDATFAMDDSEFGNNPYATKNAFVTATQRLPDSLMSWYANQGFIGFQACAIFAQNWLIEKACSMPAKDAVRNGWKAVVNDGKEESPELRAKIKRLDKKYKIKKNLIELIRNKRIFGVRIAIFVVESSDPDYYLKPFNIDGIKPGSYRGISQVDPYWMTPYMGEDSIKDPAAINFYEPTWWQIGGKRYHRSHLIIVRHAEVPDIIKPAYLYGGVPLTQQIFERIYASERTANEAPLLAMTKRMNVVKADLDKVFQNPHRFMERMAEQVAMRDNMGTRVIGIEEDYTQHETSLADLDATIMTQYQLVAAIAEVPATKIMGTSPKGFGASGDYEVATYHELLAGLQENDGTPMLERHYELMSKSDLGGSYQIEPVWNPLDEPTEKELAETNKIKADTFTSLQSSGAIDGDDIAEVLVKDPHSGFAGMTNLGSNNIEDDGDEETRPQSTAKE